MVWRCALRRPPAPRFSWLLGCALYGSLGPLGLAHSLTVVVALWAWRWRWLGLPHLPSRSPGLRQQALWYEGSKGSSLEAVRVFAVTVVKIWPGMSPLPWASPATRPRVRVPCACALRWWSVNVLGAWLLGLGVP